MHQRTNGPYIRFVPNGFILINIQVLYKTDSLFLYSLISGARCAYLSVFTICNYEAICVVIILTFSNLFIPGILSRLTCFRNCSLSEIIIDMLKSIIFKEDIRSLSVKIMFFIHKSLYKIPWECQ